MLNQTQVIRSLAACAVVAMAAASANGQGSDWRPRIVGTWNNISTGKNIMIRGVSGQQDNARLEGTTTANGRGLDGCSYHLTMLNENQINMELNTGPDTCLKGVFIRELANDQRNGAVGTWNHIASGENVVVRRIVGDLENASIEGSTSGGVIGGCSYHLTITNKYQMNLELKNGPDNCLKGVLLRVTTPAVGISAKLFFDPKDAKALNGRCNEYKNKGEYDRAIVDCSEAIRLDPKYANAYYDRGRVYEAKKDYGPAVADFTEAIKLDPNFAAAFNLRCWVRALAGSGLQEALADCNESLRLRPNDVDTLNSRGLVQLKLGNYDRAIADYGAAIAKREKDANSLYGRGVAKLKNGDTDGGNADIAAAKVIKPDIAEVYIGYGVT
jgi:tetratricopeptide (TPR) repeat protein